MKANKTSPISLIILKLLLKTKVNYLKINPSPFNYSTITQVVKIFQVMHPHSTKKI
jgi:hypothetical protein